MPAMTTHQSLRMTPLLAHQEFEDARVETDPEIINKLIITGRDAVQRTVESFMRKRSQIIQEEAAAQERCSLRATQLISTAAWMND